MSVVSLVRLLLVLFGHGYRLVFRRSVHDDVLHSLVGLARHAVEGALQHGGCVVGDGDNGENYTHNPHFL